MVKSKNNRKCISECYSKNTIVIHPLTLIPYTLKTHPFCLVDPWVDNNGDVNFGDICDEKYVKSEKSINCDIMVVPNITIDHKTFLHSIYNIHTLNEALDYIISNDHLPYNTKNRILNSVWQSFYEEIRLNKDIIINFYNNFSKNWIDIGDKDKIKCSINTVYNEIIKEIKVKKVNTMEISPNILYNDKFKKYFKINISK